MHSKSLAYEKYGLENMTEHVEFSLKFTRVYVCEPSPLRSLSHTGLSSPHHFLLLFALWLTYLKFPSGFSFYSWGTNKMVEKGYCKGVLNTHQGTLRNSK